MADLLSWKLITTTLTVFFLSKLCFSVFFPAPLSLLFFCFPFLFSESCDHLTCMYYMETLMTKQWLACHCLHGSFPHVYIYTLLFLDRKNKKNLSFFHICLHFNMVLELHWSTKFILLPQFSSCSFYLRSSCSHISHANLEFSRINLHSDRSAIDDPLSPYFLHYSNNPDLVLVSQQLVGDNYTS